MEIITAIAMLKTRAEQANRRAGSFKEQTAAGDLLKITNTIIDYYNSREQQEAELQRLKGLILFLGDVFCYNKYRIKQLLEAEPAIMYANYNRIVEQDIMQFSKPIMSKSDYLDACIIIDALCYKGTVAENKALEELKKCFQPETDMYIFCENEIAKNNEYIETLK